MLVNLHEAYWSSSLAGAMSDTYLRHFELEARQGNLDRALSVLERVRDEPQRHCLRIKCRLAKTNRQTCVP